MFSMFDFSIIMYNDLYDMIDLIGRIVYHGRLEVER